MPVLRLRGIIILWLQKSNGEVSKGENVKCSKNLRELGGSKGTSINKSKYLKLIYWIGNTKHKKTQKAETNLQYKKYEKNRGDYLETGEHWYIWQSQEK